MPAAKLTKATVDAAKPGEKDYFLWDGALSGFGLKVTPKGTKSYVFNYRTPGGRAGITRRMTIGRHGSPWTPDTARREAERHAIASKQGNDPHADRKRQAIEAVTLAFEDYAEFFIDSYLSRRWSSWKESARLLRREAIPYFGSKPLPKITKRDVTGLFDRISSPGIATNTATVLNKLFNWAGSRGDIEHSPMFRISLPDAPKARERFLDDGEMAMVWTATQTLDHPLMQAIRVLLLTGQRRDEVGAMSWEEVDLAAMTWTLPASRSKNGKAHVVPITPSVLAEMRAANSSAKGLVFSASGKQAASNWGYWKKKLDEAVESVITEKGADPIEAWRIHDLRRSVATGMQRLGISFEAIEAVANRTLVQGAGKAYHRHDYLEEKRAALHRWADHLAGINTATN